MKELGLTQADVEAARLGEPVEALSEQQQVLVRFARRVSEQPRQIDENDIASLRAVGLDNAMIVEALSVCMMAAWTNTFADALKFDLDLEGFGMRERYF